MQPRATKLQIDADAAGQLSLLPNRQPSEPVDLKYIALLTGTDDALAYACKLARRPAKDIYPDMDYDKGTWSRILSGEFDLKGREIPRLSKVLGNSAYLLYLNHLDGWDLSSLRKVQDDKDREIFELRQQVAERDRAIELFVKAAKAKG